MGDAFSVHFIFSCAESVSTISLEKNFLRQCVDVIQSVLSPSRFRLVRVVVIGESFKCFCPEKFAI